MTLLGVFCSKWAFIANFAMIFVLGWGSITNNSMKVDVFCLFFIFLLISIV